MYKRILDILKLYYLNILIKYKALLITILISGTVVLAMFSFHIKINAELISESYYEIEPYTIEELKAIETQLKAEKAAKATTNEAFNEDKEFKDMMRNFKSIASNDFQKTTDELEETSEDISRNQDDIFTSSSDYNSPLELILFKKTNVNLSIKLTTF